MRNTPIRDKLTDDRGQVGIGTLIVFIALVLVAAIAAGVLINTAGFLQTQAEETGEDSTDQVADNVNVIGEVGDVVAFDSNNDDTLDSNYLTEVRLTVQRSAGSSEIDLTGLNIQWVGDNGFAQLIHASDTSAPTLNIDDDGQAGSDTELSIDTDESQIGTAGDATYLVDVVTAESSTDAVITDDGDRYEIVIPLASAFDGTNFLVVDGDLATINDPEDVAGGGSNPATDPLLGDIRDDYAGLDVEEGGSTAFDNTDLELLEEGQRAELEITTDTGATRNVVISAPDTFIGEVGSSVTL